MYLLTSLPIETAQQAWEYLFSYMHRWEIEQGFRFLKSEMAIESPRLCFFENRLKIMAMVTLIYHFDLELPSPIVYLAFSSISYKIRDDSCFFVSSRS